jgi:hypothetical protein
VRSSACCLSRDRPADRERCAEAKRKLATRRRRYTQDYADATPLEDARLIAAAPEVLASAVSA